MLENLASTLKQLRESAKKSQKEVSEKTGITPAALSAYEQGTKMPQLNNAVKLAEYYGISLDEMCGIPERPRKRTRADCLRALVLLREQTQNAQISTGDMNYEQTPLYCEETFDPSLEGATVTYGTLTLWESWAGQFMRNYERLRALREDGALEQGLFDVIVNNMYAEAEKWPLRSDIFSSEPDNF